MTPSVATGGLKDCVPVSTAGMHVQNLETHQRIPEQLARILLDCEPNQLVAALVVKGWTLGDDAELLPPRSWFEVNA